eukprot:gene18463-24173_t
MGHKPSLLKAIGHFSNFSLGFNSVSVFASISLAYGYGLNFGGPVTMVWGWLVTFFFSVLVTLSLAEIASVYPIAGSVFHWSGLLTPKEDSAIACYICGWMSFLCNSSCDAAFAFAATQFFNAAITADGMSSVTVTGRVTFALLREKILPFSDYWTEVHSETKAPIKYHFIGPAEKMDAERQALLASIEVSSDEEDDDEFNYEGSDGFSGSRTPFFSPPATSYPTALNTPYNRSRSNSPPTGVSIAPSPIKVQIQRSAWPSTSSQSSSDNRQGGSISRFSPEGSIDSYNDNDNDSSDLFTSAFDRSSSKSQTLTNESGRPPRPKSQQTSSNPSPIKSILKKERNQSVDSSKTDSQDDDKQSSKQQQSDQNEYEDVGSDVFSSILEERYER